MNSRSATVIALAVAAVGTSALAADPADLSRLVVVGDSLSAGYQSSCLREDQQVHGYASLVAEQAGVELPLPLIEGPAHGNVGFPPCLVLVDPNLLLVIRDPAFDPSDPALRVDPTVAAWNLAVPGARVEDLLDPAPDNAFHGIFGFPYQEMHSLVPLGHPPGKTVIELAEDLWPTTVILWIGSNDVLWSMIGGTAEFITPEEDFRFAFAEVIERLAETGATLVVADIPDITVVPFVTPAPEFASRFGLDLDTLGLDSGDFVTTLPASALVAGVFGPFLGPLPNDDVAVCPIPGLVRCDVVLDAEDAKLINQATRRFNKVIRKEAQKHGAGLVKASALLDMADQKGFDIRLEVDGEDATRTIRTDYLGGVFTLDGLHPSNTGYAVLADLFISVLNKKFDAGIDRLEDEDIAEIFVTDPVNPDNVPGL